MFLLKILIKRDNKNQFFLAPKGEYFDHISANIVANWIEYYVYFDSGATHRSHNVCIVSVQLQPGNYR